MKPTQRQIQEFENYLDICRSVYNYAHRERVDWINSRKCPVARCSLVAEYIIPANTPYPGYNHQAKSLTKAKKSLPHLKQVNAQVLQQVLKRLAQAWLDFYKNGKGFPRFKTRNRFRSFVFPQLAKDCLGNNRIKLPSIGWIKIRQSRLYPTGFVPKQFQVVRKATGWFALITFQSKESVPDPVPGKVSLGIDAGILCFIATSSGVLIESPRFLLNALRKLRLLQRRLKKKVKFSNNWLKLQNKISKLHYKITCCRKDWLYKLAHTVCNDTDNIFVEDINFTSWAKGLFGKHSLDSGIGGFINQILPFVAWKRGKYYHKVDKNYTSQTCPNCGSHTGKKKLSERIHNCSECGYSENRDIASAIVIKQRGLKAVGHTVN